jgi:hypothetical protein
VKSRVYRPGFEPVPYRKRVTDRAQLHVSVSVPCRAVPLLAKLFPHNRAASTQDRVSHWPDRSMSVPSCNKRQNALMHSVPIGQCAVQGYNDHHQIINNSSDDEDDCLLLCCKVLSGRNWPTFQKCLLHPSSGRWMGAVSTSETSVNF